MMESGIYYIKNNIDKKFYVGSTKNFKKRKYKHFLNLRKKRHTNNHLQNAYNLYGEENFIFEKVVICPQEVLLNIEQSFLNVLYDKDHTTIYNENNLASKPPSMLGKKMSEEQKRKIGESQKRIGNKPPGWLGKSRSEETKRKLSISHKKAGILPPSRKGAELTKKHKEAISKSNMKNVKQFTKEGIFLKEWQSINDAAKSVGVKNNTVSSCLTGKIKTAGGFIWKYA